MRQNQNLHQAKRQKEDEFKTHLLDIEKELSYYIEHFQHKVVYCNCDDPSESNFFKYFSDNFERLKLKKLISTGYNKCVRNLFECGEPTKGMIVTKNQKYKFNLKGDGDFRSEECIELLKQSDIVVTNPPFSLFREYVAQLMKYDKKFIIIGHQNAITYKDFFPLIKQQKVWLGQGVSSGNMEFQVPEHYSLNTTCSRVDDQGNKFIFVSGVRWFTNIIYPKRHDRLKLYKKYSPEEYPTYDNYDAIEVSKVKEIPMDYDGEMGVPITFLSKHNPDQFEIVRFRKGNDGKDLRVNGKCPYFRIIIKRIC